MFLLLISFTLFVQDKTHNIKQGTDYYFCPLFYTIQRGKCTFTNFKIGDIFQQQKQIQF